MSLKAKVSADFFVSLEGSDSWAGTLPAPAQDKTDGPFATLARARDAVRELNKAKTDSDISVFIRGGMYVLKETVVFHLEDGGNEKQRITYAAYPNETPVYSSGVPITGWQKPEKDPAALPEKARGNIWVADIPDEIGRILTLFDGDKRLLRARGKGFMAEKVKFEATRSFNVVKKDDRYLYKRIPFPEGALKKWSNVEDAEVFSIPVPWCLNILPLESVDEKQRVAWAAIEGTCPPFAKPSSPAWVENMIDFLDEPGEWVVNTKERKIYLWPLGDEPGEHIVAPYLKEFIRVEGHIDDEAPVDIPIRNLTFRGLTFTHGERDVWDFDHKGWGIQHDWEKVDRGTALMRFRGAEHCEVRECRFTNSGGTALRLDLHAQHNRITGNLIDYMGSVGILLSGYGPGTKDVNKNNEISNNIIHHIGEILLHGQAIIISQSGDNTIANNCIHHCPRLGISICGVRVPVLEDRHIDYDDSSKIIRWDEIDKTIAKEGDNWDRFMPFLHSRNNVVRDNEIYRVLEALRDGAGINVTGAGEGNVIERNYVHHIAVHRGAGAMRVDDWQRGTTFRNNVIYMLNIGGFTRKNLTHIENNIVVDVSVRGYVRFASYPNEEAHHGSRLQRNIFYDSGDGVKYYAPAYMVSDGISLPKDCDADYNCFYCAGNPEVSEAFLKEQWKDSIEHNSISADPLFKDIEHENFELKPESPAFNLGFQPIDMSQIGLRDDYPGHLKALDESFDDSHPEFHRGRDETKKGHDFW